MARPKRLLYENAVYHITSRGNERQKIVLDDRDRFIFLEVLAEAIEEHKVLCHAWVLMDNHYHLLVETPEKNLPKFMAQLNGVYTLKFNKRHQRVGHLFQGRYKSIHVDKDIYLKELCRYVVLNPVRAKMKEHPGQWRWSSYRATAGLEKAPQWLEIRWVLGQFGRNLRSAQKSYRAYVLKSMKVEDSPWEKAKHGLYLGGEKFLAKMQALAVQDISLDIPKYQKKLVRPSIKEVFEKVAKNHGMKLSGLMARKRGMAEIRDVGIYLLKKEYGYSLKEIGEVMGVGFSAVGNRWQGMKRRLMKEEGLDKMVAKCRM